MHPPRYLPLYKRLFGGGAGFWGSASGSPNLGVGAGQNAELRMDSMSGCPDEALLAIAEVSALASWKLGELRSGSLSVRELVRRGDQIEKELRERAAGKPPGTGAGIGIGVGVGDEEEFSKAQAMMEHGMTPAGLPMAMATPGMSGPSRATRSPVDTTKHIIGEMFREAAVLYLHTVLSDSVPGEDGSPVSVFCARG